MIITEKGIFDELVPLLTETLGVPPGRIRMESVLVADLGAESIDLLDLSFRIEDRFKITVEANEIEREARKHLPGGEYEKEGLLTDEALAEIRRAAPELDAGKIVRGLRKRDLPALLNVAFFVHLIKRKLSAASPELSPKGDE
jgi:acyl carrier protein